MSTLYDFIDGLPLKYFCKEGGFKTVAELKEYILWKYYNTPDINTITDEDLANCLKNEPGCQLEKIVKITYNIDWDD